MIRRVMFACATLVLFLLVVTACTVVRVTTVPPMCTGDGRCTLRLTHLHLGPPGPTFRYLWLRLPTGPVYLCEWATMPRHDGTLKRSFRIQLPSGPVVLYPWRHD